MNEMEHKEKFLQVQKTARYFQLGELSEQTETVWIVLHGYGQLASFFVKHFEGLVDAHTTVLAPEGLSRFYLDGKWERVGATWMTKEDRLHEIEDYIGYLNGLFANVLMSCGKMPKIHLLGFSQGTATAWRWLAKGNAKISSLVLWAGGVGADYMDLMAEKLQHCQLHFVLGDKDQYVSIDQAQQQLEGLRQLKPDLQFWQFEGEHRMDAETLGKLAKELA